MNKLMLLLLVGLPSVALAAGRTQAANQDENNKERIEAMDLGAFSVSLAVKDLAASRDFYGKLGFEPVGGSADQNWLILRNGGTTIGLFQGMFEQNILTFNPGWDDQAEEVDAFTDVRELQRRLKAEGLTLVQSADESTSGPASITLVDPDGNPILIDQHR